MLNPIEIINKLLNSPGGIFEIISLSIIILCVFAILMSIMINFAEAKGDKPRKEKKSIVETGTMFLFFIAFYLIIRFRIGDLNVTDLGIRAPLTIFGLIVIVVGTMVNVRGRISLGKNWANQIKIYEDHR
ncbi:MAG: hypothetical protein WCK90_05835, partial [archaeon]